MRVLFLFFIFFSLSLNAQGFPVPDDNEVNFDVIRKKKIIGNLTTKFLKKNELLILHSILDIEVKVLFIPAYKFFQETKETWLNGDFIAIDGFTDFEDDREYKIDGKDENGMFIANGMDGIIEMDEKIVPLNYWNKAMLDESKVFDTQKGIVREISVQKLKNEKIKINKSYYETEKFVFNASINPKDLGPFPEYTLWYYKDELFKMEFQNPKDKKTITIIRTDLEKK